MIAHLRGRVLRRTADAVVVDVNGVGYLVHVTGAMAVPPRGEPVELFTSLQVREDSMTLYGFGDETGLSLFELLLTSSGVGPKLAMAALSTHRADVLTAAIATGDLATLTAIPGVGKKVAERLVLELRDKVGLPATDNDGVEGAVPGTTLLGEARAALATLGYRAGEIEDALAAVGHHDDLDQLLRAALGVLGRAVAAR